MKRYLLCTLLVSSGLIGLTVQAPYAEENDNPDDSESGSDSSENGVVATDIKTNCTCGWANKEDQRIVNGKVTKTNEFPMIVGLVFLDWNKIVCGGTIITERHIITAGHCTVRFKPYEMGIHLGYYNYEEIKNSSGTKLLEIEEFIVHEKYYFLTLLYDVAIIVTKESIVFTQNVGPVCLPTGPLTLPGKKVTVLGWGKTKYRGQISDKLMKVNLDIVPFERCIDDNMNLELNDRHQVCTFTKGKDSCNGDSGGPLLWLDSDTNRYTLVATTSYGYNCAKYPVVNSDINYFLPWIQQVVSKYSKRVPHPKDNSNRLPKPYFLPWLQKRSLETSSYRTCAKVL